MSSRKFGRVFRAIPYRHQRQLLDLLHTYDLCNDASHTLHVTRTSSASRAACTETLVPLRILEASYAETPFNSLRPIDADATQLAQSNNKGSIWGTLINSLLSKYSQD